MNMLIIVVIIGLAAAGFDLSSGGAGAPSP